jgi:urease accessory protein
MQLAEPLVSGWHAELALEFERRVVAGSPRSVLASRRHDGPLVVQKPLYPEGDEVCHVIVVHPPAGIAGGDHLQLTARVGSGANALLTTPGAAKWYRSSGAWARQQILLDIQDGATVEWLPQETIVFDGAVAEMRTEVTLTGSAAFLGWEILCLGRAGSGERFERGHCSMLNRIVRDGKPLWHERAAFEGGAALLTSPVGLGGRTVCGTLIAATSLADDLALTPLREIAPREGDAAISRMPGLLVARYLGDSSEAAREYFIALWALLRPALTGRPAVAPRIWRT